jgi:DNA ligase-1
MPMSDWVTLFEAIEASNKTSDKVKALLAFFELANEEDKLWLIAIFTGRKPKKPITATEMREWAAEAAGVEQWLFEECYSVVGDVSETIALLLQTKSSDQPIHFTLSQLMHELIRIGKLPTDEKKDVLQNLWLKLDKGSCFLFNKMMTGGFRIGVSQQLLVQALATHLKVTGPQIAHRIMGNWSPLTHQFQELLLNPNPNADASKPYPFYLAYPLEINPEELGDVAQWQIEYKWDGIRCQLIKRNNQVYLWSRGEELISDNFPDLIAAAMALPTGTVLDGELMAWEHNAALPFALLQKRITRKKPSKKIIAECPCAILIYDLLEYNGVDFRTQELYVRRSVLAELIGTELPLLHLSPTLHLKDWEAVTKARLESRNLRAEGLMLKSVQSPYQSGRKRGDWWKWKVDPYQIDAVLVYAQKGHGRRANLYTDYTFAVWHQQKLVTFTKAYSGLTDKELEMVDQFVKKNTLEKFGPVRTVKPELVFEIGFEGIQESARHKSGVALRFPRILKWRTDKKAEDANTLDELKRLL